MTQDDIKRTYFTFAEYTILHQFQEMRELEDDRHLDCLQNDAWSVLSIPVPAKVQLARFESIINNTSLTLKVWSNIAILFLYFFKINRSSSLTRQQIEEGMQNNSDEFLPATSLFILMVPRGFLEILHIKRSFLYYWRGSE